MKGMNQIAKVLSAVAVGAYIALVPAKADAEFFAAEVIAGNESSTLDSVIGGNIEDAGIVGRVRSTVDYEGDAITLGLIDFTHDIYSGISAIFESQITGEGVSFRPGLMYTGSWGDFSLYTQVTANLDETTDVEVIFTPRYSPDFNERLGLVMQAECGSNFGSSGHNFSVQRLRLGLNIQTSENTSVEIGAAGDLLEVGNSGDFSYNVGGYVRLRR